MTWKSSQLAKCAVRLGAAAMATVALSGCQSIDMSSAQVRVIDASPDAGVIDFYQNNAGLAYNLQFGTVTSYVPMTPGEYRLSADRAGTRQTLAASTVMLAATKQYTEIVGNSAANLQEMLLLDQSTPAAAGQVAVRFVQAATRSGAVDVYLVPRGGRLAGSSPVAVNLSLGQNSGYLTVPAGTYAIDVVPAGKTLAASTVTLQSGAQMEYGSGAVRTVVLIDQEIVGAHPTAVTPGVQAIVQTDVEGQ